MGLGEGLGEGGGEGLGEGGGEVRYVYVPDLEVRDPHNINDHVKVHYYYYQQYRIVVYL